MRIQSGVGLAFVACCLLISGSCSPATDPKPAKSSAKPSATTKSKPATKAKATVAEPKPEIAATAEPKDAGPKDAAPAAKAARPSNAPAPPNARELADAELSMPKVIMTEHHAKMCPIGVGGELPDFQLADLAGKQQSLSNLLGKKLTVVTFWNSAQPNALEELADLGPDILNRFEQYGVAVVGINEADEPARARELAEAAKTKFPNLSDPDASAFHKVATEKLPRTYLVDASRNVVWFDIEYSRTTRRELSQAIRYWLAHESNSEKSPTP